MKTKAKKKTAEKNPRTRKFLILSGIIAFAGMLLRLLVAGELISGDPFAFDPPAVTDMATYLQMSAEILSGKLPDTFYYQPFYSAVFLPFFRIFIRSAPWAAAIGQILCAGGIIYLSALAGARLWGRKAGIIAAFLAAFSTMLTFYVPYALIEIQQCFWITLLFYLTLLAMKRKTLLLWASAGIVLGISILSRGNSWCFAPLVIIAALYAGKFRLSGWKYAAIVFLAILLPQLPFIGYNCYKTGTFAGPSTAAPAVLGLGNNPEAPPGYLVYPHTYESWMNHHAEIPLTTRIADWAKDEPLAFCELSFRKFLLFWDAREIPNNVSLEINGSKSACLKLAFVPTWFIVMLAVASFVLMLPKMWKKKKFLLLLLFILAYAAATAAFYILARFRVPCIGLFCIAASCFPIYVYWDIRKKDYRRLLIFKGFALLCGLFLTLWAYDSYRSVEWSIMRIARPDGVRVDLPELNEVTIYDNGPMEFGDWRQIPLSSGLSLTKTFSPGVKGFPFGKALLRFNFFAEGANEFIMTVNGRAKSVRIDAAKPEFQEISMEVNCPDDLTFRVSFSGVRNDSTLLNIDFQRNYGRSVLNGEALDGEFVISLTGIPESKLLEE